MYLVAQIYGIRLKYLYKINHLSPDYQLKVGDRLRVY
jgi:LysM repeat protein